MGISAVENRKVFVDRNYVDLRASFFSMTALPGESIFFPWTNRVDVEVFQRIFPSHRRFRLRFFVHLSHLLSSEFYSIVRRELAGRLKARLALYETPEEPKKKKKERKRGKFEMIYCFSRGTLGI